MYLFTNKTGRLVIDIVVDPEWLGQQALEHRQKLENVIGKPVIAWCRMGGNNHIPEK